MEVKVCNGCSLTKPIDQFPTRKDIKRPTSRPYCYDCAADGQRSRYSYHKKSQPFKLKSSRAASRASSIKVPFDLTPEYLESIWDGKCAATGVSINLYGNRSDEFTAELDRFIPERGYVKDNVHFLSRKMNRLKNNAGVDELEKLLNWMKKVENGS